MYAMHILLVVTAAQTAAQEPVSVSPLGGDLRVYRHAVKETQPIRETGPVLPDDRLGCVNRGVGGLLAEGSAQIILKGVEAGREQGLSLSKQDKTLVIRLYRGSIAVDAGKTQIALEAGGRKIEGKDVIFRVEESGETARIILYYGTMSFLNRPGEAPVELKEGETLELKGGKDPTRRPTVAADREPPPWARPAFNAFENGGFEAGLRSWETGHTAKGPLVTVDTAERFEGRASALITLPDVVFGAETDNCYVPLFQRRERVLKTGEKYLLKLMMRTEGFRVAGQEARVPLSIVFNAQGNIDERLSEKIPTPQNMERRWTPIRVVVTARGEDARIVICTGYDNNSFSGKVWIDDVQLDRQPVR